ncbi:hypothetical protein MOMA_05155 [Moraxella macacae 0408225]|uniref:Uncharacterized protein n=1 Tax=Moraxella macacae 0408225 TaxID=1230338 RepID=L2FBE3_9GAMM|nr:putative DNA-binding domain-containing protein [Moraxella macacae]ELA09763.1 hypothetical protein MOMA_05155 [Moraxella macacae 0408225]
MTNHTIAPILNRSLDMPFVVHQQAFANFLRQQNSVDQNLPLSAPLDDLSPRIGKLYQSLVCNNVTSFVNQCFPVCQTLVDSVLWQQLIQLFIQSNHLKSPYFIEINRQFCEFLADTTCLVDLGLPLFLGELAHYEWIELWVETLPNEAFHQVLPMLFINPTLQVLQYDWAVHEISSKTQPIATPTFLLVYRQGTRVKFMQTNSLTFLLLDFLQQSIHDNQAFHNSAVLLDAFSHHYELPQLSCHDFEQLVADFSQQHIFSQRSVV